MSDDATKLGMFIHRVGKDLDARARLCHQANQPQPFDALGTPLKVGNPDAMEQWASMNNLDLESVYAGDPKPEKPENTLMRMNVLKGEYTHAADEGVPIKDMVVKLDYNDFMTLVQIASSAQLLEAQVKSLTERLDNAQWATAAAEGRAL